MYVTDEIIGRMEQTYGTPEFREFVIPCSQQEVAFVASTQRDGRNHDVTVYVRRAEKLVVIAKHFYPPGLYRAPSGGIHKGEEFETGAKREIREECGCEIALRTFLLRTSVRFTAREHGGTEVNWRSFVFLADYVSGDFQFTDSHEIREVRLADWSEFGEFGRIMRQEGRGGFRYRAALHEAVEAIAR
jgi:8-oxo-dGTP pyrophosphatase MutT (NUDIX family)